MLVTDEVTTALLRSIGGVTGRLAPQKRTAVGRRLGAVLKLLSSKRRHITRQNIQRAFPGMAADAISTIVQESYNNLGITLGEILSFPWRTRPDLMSSISLPGIEQVAHRAANKEPTVLISGHYGNWELLALCGALYADTSFTIVVHPLSNRLADRVMTEYRTRFGNRIVPMASASRNLMRTLDAGGTVAFLADQHAPRDRYPLIPFMGTPTPTYTTPAALALRFGAAMYAGFAHRNADGTTYSAPIECVNSAHLPYSESGILELTRRHVAMLEDAIRRSPAMWMWQHRRWRNDDTES